MQHTSTIKFIFKSQNIVTNITANDIRHFPDNILFSFINDPHEYQIQSDVSKEVFDSIIKYFDQHELPDIQIHNYYSYIELNKELCIPAISNLLESLKDKWETCLLNIASLNDESIVIKSDIEEEMAKNLDNYIIQYGQQLINLPIQTLYRIFNHPNRKISEHNRLYELIIQHYKETNNMEIFTLLPSIDARDLEEKNIQDSIDSYSSHGNFAPSFAFSAISKEIHKLKRCQRNYYKIIRVIHNFDSHKLQNVKNAVLSYSGNEHINDAGNFNFKFVTIDNGLKFCLIDDEMRAEMYISENVSCDLLIPRYVTFENQKYTIKNLVMNKITNSNINSIDFPDDSEIEAFEYEEGFTRLIDITVSMGDNYFLSIQSIKIPRSVKKLNEGWCHGFKNLINVEISQDNKYFKMLDNKCIVGKSNENEELFDIIVFGKRNIEEMVIPSYIKKIDSFCYEYCTKLVKIEIFPDCQLDRIWKYSFSSTAIEYIKIPSSVTNIEDYAFYNCSKLTAIEIPPDSKLELIGKHSLSSTAIETIKIPSGVTKIKEFAFYNCTKLALIEIQSDSKLEII